MDEIFLLPVYEQKDNHIYVNIRLAENLLMYKMNKITQGKNILHPVIFQLITIACYEKYKKTFKSFVAIQCKTIHYFIVHF